MAFGVYAGIDQGTTTSRVLTINEQGQYKIAHSCGHRQITPRAGWVEHDPEELIKNLKECIDKAGNIDALGIDNQGESVVAWDSETGEAVYNVIVWQDARTQDEIQKLKDKGYEKLVQERCGLPLDPYFSASKLAWIIKNVPRAQKLLDKGRLMLGTTDTFFMYRLCGVYATDYNTASRTSLLNLKTLQWDEELCRIFEVPIEILPPIKDCIGIFGYTKNSQGLSIPLSASLVDQFACIYGHGCRKPGDAKITFGTGAFMESLTGYDIPQNKFGLLPVLAWKFPNEKPMFGLDGGVYNAASAVNWAKKVGLFNSYSEINSFDKEYAICRDLIFIPALSGLSCPYWDRSAAALWVGMGLETENKDMMQALIEGVALRANTVLKAMSEVCDLGNTLSIDGGMTANPYFMQFLADITQKEIKVPACSEISSYGTAILARRGIGLEGDIKLSGDPTIYKPNPLNTQELMAKFEQAVSRCRGIRSIKAEI